MSDNGENWDDPEWVLSKLADELTSIDRDRNRNIYSNKLHGIFKKVSDRLRGDRVFLLKVVEEHGSALGYASAELKKDREFLLQAVKNNSVALHYASDALKKDREIVLEAVKNNGRALAFASNELKRDMEIAAAAAVQTKDALQFVPDDIRPGVEARVTPMKRQPRPRNILADRPGGEDQLDLKLMAYAIADILVSKNLSTPFVTGLFGDWGSGKSFLIHLIEQRLGEIMSQDLRKPEFENIEDYPFCGHIYTVHFNAWTYSKDELWASLMYRILYDLNEQLDLEAHIRSLPGDFCRRGVDFIDLKRKLRSVEMKEAFKKYTTKELAGLSYEPKMDGKASKELIRVMNKAFRGDVEDLPKKIRELERLNARINRRHWISGFWKTTEERFRSELKKYRESNPSDESIADMLQSVGILKRWSKLLLGGINRSPASLLFIILFVACAIAVTVIVFTDNMGKLEEYVNAFYSSIGAFLSLGVGTAVNTIRKAQKALDDLGVTGAIVSADAAVEKFEDSLAAMEEGEPRESDLAQRHRLECEISAMKNRRWLVEGDSLHDQVRDRLKLSHYEDRLGIVHQAQEDLEMLSRAMELAYKHGNSDEERRTANLDQEKAPQSSEEVDDSSNEGEILCWSKLLVTVCPIFGCLGCYKLWLFVLPQFVSSKFSAFWRSCTDILEKFVVAVSSMKTKIASSRFCKVISWGFLHDDDNDDYINEMSEAFGVKFEEQKENKSNPKEQKDEPRFPRGKPRIVLFIDDLDRCPPEKVVDVIEALQLLLDRTDVFVAIVALDVRYVTRALEKKYKDILIKDSEPSGLQYLQKIIQLPFSVPRMSPDGIKNYFEHQLSNKGRNENSKKRLHENSIDAKKSDEEKQPKVPSSDMVNEEDGSTSNAINEEGGRINYRDDEVSSLDISLTMPDVDEASPASPEVEQAAPSSLEKEEGDAPKSDEEKEPAVPRRDNFNAEGGISTRQRNDDESSLGQSLPLPDPAAGSDTSPKVEHAAPFSLEKEESSLSNQETTNATTFGPDNEGDNRKNPSESSSLGLESGDNNSPFHSSSVEEQQETDYIFANEEQEISDEENDTLSVERTDFCEEPEFSDEEDNTSSDEQEENDYIFEQEQEESDYITNYREDEVSWLGLRLTMADVDEASITSPEDEQTALSLLEKEESSLSNQETTNATTSSPGNEGDNRNNPSESSSSGFESGDKDSPIDEGGVVGKDEETASPEEQQEQEETNYIFANEEQEFSDEEVEMITVAGQAARINPRSGRMIANVFKVLKNIWARKNDEPESSVKQAIMHLLSFAASNQLLMGRVLANLEDELLSGPDVGEKTLHQFWMEQLRNCPTNHRPKNHRSFGKTSETWGNVTLEKIGYEDVRLMRSFSFVGYLTSVEDMLTEATEDESEEEQRQQQQQQELQHLLQQLQQQQQEQQQQQQRFVGVTFIRGNYSLSLIPSDVATLEYGHDLLNHARRISLAAQNPIFNLSPEEREALEREEKEIRFEVNGLRLPKDQFVKTPIRDIVYGDVPFIDITISVDVRPREEPLPEDVLDRFWV